MATAEQLRTLANFSACDVSDALLKLKVPGAGFLADICKKAKNYRGLELSSQPKLVGLASTVLFVPNEATTEPTDAVFQNIKISNIPLEKHYVDLTKSDTVMVLSQPPSQRCAVLGGIMALRMEACAAKGVIVVGRIRDLAELRSMHFPVWAMGTSTVGTGMEAKPWAIDVPITVQGIEISPGDVVFGDPVEGVVIIPKAKIDAVLELLPQLTSADNKVKEDVIKGWTVKEAFATHRGK